MRELWDWEIERGREFTAHCRHSRKTEIRILNRTKNCVSSSKLRLRLRVWKSERTEYACKKYKGRISDVLSQHDVSHIIAADLWNASYHSQDLLQDKDIFTIKIFTFHFKSGKEAHEE